MPLCVEMLHLEQNNRTLAPGIKYHLLWEGRFEKQNAIFEFRAFTEYDSMVKRTAIINYRARQKSAKFFQCTFNDV